jgi:hypothetical protein
VVARGGTVYTPPLNDSGWYPHGFIGYQNYPLNSMKIYGDSSIKLLQRYLTVNCDPNCGYVDSGSTFIDYGNPVYITARPYAGYTVSGWMVDGQPYGYYPSGTLVPQSICLLMYSDHTVEPIFSAIPQGQCSLTLEARCTSGDLLWDGNIYLDNNWVGQGQWAGYVDYGYHEVRFDQVIDNAYAYYYVNEYGYFGYCDNGYLNDNPTTITEYYIAG